MQFVKGNQQGIEIVRGDITTCEVDAIVNAANTTLLGGGGVDGAIHRAAGPELLAECRTLGGCQSGEAKITRGYRLPARFVIHTVGPVWHGGKHGEPETLANCYRNSLQVAVENGIKTLAFPAISCGAYGYPIEEAAQIALKTTREFLANDSMIEKVIFALFSKDLYEAYRNALKK
jgi:O-acetyl-ADP-ribose deacetylase (regulator of RNase III)